MSNKRSNKRVRRRNDVVLPDHLEPYRLSSGVMVYFTSVPATIMDRVNSRIKTPDIPREAIGDEWSHMAEMDVYSDEYAVELQKAKAQGATIISNEDHPQYAAAMKLTENKRSAEMIRAIMVVCAHVCDENGNKTDLPEDSTWVPQAFYVAPEEFPEGFDPDNPVWANQMIRKQHFMELHAFGMEDVEILLQMSALLKLQDRVAEAAATFPSSN